LWNKFGAALSNGLQTKEAIRAYEQALDLRPNYIRAIVNVGLAQNNLTDYKAAANCYLNALVLNPALKHVWTYLRTSILQMNRFDLLEKCEQRDP
jgi:peroxin-5